MGRQLSSYHLSRLAACQSWTPIGQIRNHTQYNAFEASSTLLVFSLRKEQWSRPEAVQDPKWGQREAFAPGTRGACTGTVQPSTRTVPREESTQRYESFEWLLLTASPPLTVQVKI